MQSSNVLLTSLLLRHALLASAVSLNLLALQDLSTHVFCSQQACMGPGSFAAVLHVQSPGSSWDRKGVQLERKPFQPCSKLY